MLFRTRWLITLLDVLLCAARRLHLLGGRRHRRWRFAARRETLRLSRGFGNYLRGAPYLAAMSIACTIVFLLSLFSFPALLVWGLGYAADYVGILAGIQARQLASVRDALAGRGSFSFAVVGNINNSVGIFERKIVPILNDSGVNFVVSAGNAVSGGGEDRDSLQARIDSHGAGAEILLTGPVSPEEIPACYALGDVFLFASKTETQGMVILEAMAAGLPVVAVRSSGIDDVVQDGFNGFKTPENREMWSARARTLITDEALRGTIAGNARSFAQQFDIDGVAGNVAEVYAFACAVRSGGRDAAGGQAAGS